MASLVTVVSLLALMSGAYAYPKGSGSCSAEIGAVRQMVYAKRNFDLSGGFSLTSSVDEVLPGDEVELTLTHTASMPFRGFVFYAEDDNKDRVGIFTDESEYGATNPLPSQCNKGDTITHNDPGDKISVTVKWQAPDWDPVTTGKYTFKTIVYTNVDDNQDFWNPGDVVLTATGGVTVEKGKRPHKCTEQCSQPQEGEGGVGDEGDDEKSGEKDFNDDTAESNGDGMQVCAQCMGDPDNCFSDHPCCLAADRVAKGDCVMYMMEVTFPDLMYVYSWLANHCGFDFNMACHDDMDTGLVCTTKEWAAENVDAATFSKLMADLSQPCGVDCLVGPTACSKCVIELDLVNDFGPGCDNCMSELVRCDAQHCAKQCTCRQDGSCLVGDECDSCLIGNCGSSFLECSGVVWEGARVIQYAQCVGSGWRPVKDISRFNQLGVTVSAPCEDRCISLHEPVQDQASIQTCLACEDMMAESCPPAISEACAEADHSFCAPCALDPVGQDCQLASFNFLETCGTKQRVDTIATCKRCLANEMTVLNYLDVFTGCVDCLADVLLCPACLAVCKCRYDDTCGEPDACSQCTTTQCNEQFLECSGAALPGNQACSSKNSPGAVEIWTADGWDKTFNDLFNVCYTECFIGINTDGVNVCEDCVEARMPQLALEVTAPCSDCFSLYLRCLSSQCVLCTSCRNEKTCSLDDTCSDCAQEQGCNELFLNCAGRPIYGEKKAETFNFQSCSGGSGSFSAFLGVKDDQSLIGFIPAGQVDLTVNLKSQHDLDIRLYDLDDTSEYDEGQAIVSWCDKTIDPKCNEGTLRKSGYEEKDYKGMPVTYSGYYGNGSKTTCCKGHEFIKIEGRLDVPVTMYAYAYAIGEAEVDYTWAKTDTACCRGEGLCGGSFGATLKYKEYTEVGTVPAGVLNLEIFLTADQDLDIQVLDMEDTSQYSEGQAIVAYCDRKDKFCNRGVLGDKRDERTKQYKGLKYTYSGYDGVDGKGNEFIKLEGTTNRELMIRIFAYRPGTADVTYTYMQEVPTS